MITLHTFICCCIYIWGDREKTHSFRSWFSRHWHCAKLEIVTNILEELASSIFKVEVLVTICIKAQCQNPDHNLNLHCCENFKCW